MIDLATPRPMRLWRGFPRPQNMEGGLQDGASGKWRLGSKGTKPKAKPPLAAEASELTIQILQRACFDMSPDATASKWDTPTGALGESPRERILLAPRIRAQAFAGDGRWT